MRLGLGVAVCGMALLGAGVGRAMAQGVTQGAAETIAQGYGHTQGGVELAVMYEGERSLKAGTQQNFWMQGGSMELGVDAWRGWGIAVDVTGGHGGSIGSSGVPVSVVTVAFGPRYRFYEGRRVSAYAQGLIGEADGFSSVFPTAAGAQVEANGFAAEVGGGADYSISRRLAVRVVEAMWVRTQLPNGGDNSQDDVRVSAGVVLRFGRE